MIPFNWGRGPSSGGYDPKPEYAIPDAESRESAEQRAEIEQIDRHLDALRLIPKTKRATAWHAQLDRLLSKRNAIRAPKPPAEVPVIPGRNP